MWRSIEPRRSTAGFTLIEVLVALSIVATTLASIGALIASTARGTRSIETHLNRLEIARAIMTAIPDRDQLTPGNFSGEMAGHPWRVDVLPFVSNNMEPQNDTLWVPQTVVMTVRSPAGAAMQVSTVRIQRRGGG